MKQRGDDYSTFVNHPRFGRGPRFTDVVVREVPGYHTSLFSENAITGTAVAADLNRQSFSSVPVLYYFDREAKCIDCGRPFIFFAEEQKYWYETLGFYLWAGCNRCIDCRSRRHGLERRRRRYEELFHLEHRTVDETLDMAECSVTLIEDGIFHRRQTERIRMLLNTLPDERNENITRRYNEIRQRVIGIESVGGAH